MTVKFCDRCGKKMERGDGLNVIRAYNVTKSPIPSMEVELCNSCYKAFEDWIGLQISDKLAHNGGD